MTAKVPSPTHPSLQQTERSPGGHERPTSACKDRQDPIFRVSKIVQNCTDILRFSFSVPFVSC